MFDEKVIIVDFVGKWEIFFELVYFSMDMCGWVMIFKFGISFFSSGWVVVDFSKRVLECLCRFRIWLVNMWL